MRFTKRMATAAAVITATTATGAWAQTGQTKSADTQTAQKARTLGVTPSMLTGLTPAEQRTLTRLLNRMTAAERQAVAKLVRNSARPTGGGMGNMNGSGTGTGTSGTGATGTGTGTGSGGTGTSEGLPPGTNPGTTP